jgi:hypothetical protein
MGKRFERVESAYPRTLALLDRIQPGARGHYLATTPFPRSEAEERAIFRAYVGRGEGRPAHLQRLLEDVADMEAALPTPAMRLAIAPDARVRATGQGVLHARGPLDEALATGLLDLPDYPDAPRDLLLFREGSALELAPLDAAGRALLDACDGTRAWADLTATPDAEARLRRWLQQGVVSAG